MTHPYLDHNGVIAFAHRGGADEGPENTMSAFQRAVDMGYTYLETDAHVTRDGVLLAFHDPSLDRVTDRAGMIANMDYADVKQARIAGTEPIPLLEDVLGAWPHTKINIDPKSDEAVAPLIETIKRLDLVDRVCVGSFVEERLRRVRAAFGPRLCTSMARWDIARLRFASFGFPSKATSAACAQVPVIRKGIVVTDQRFVDKAHALGLPVHVWTINQRAEMERLLDMGVDGVMTDNLTLLKDVLTERGLWPS